MTKGDIGRRRGCHIGRRRGCLFLTPCLLWVPYSSPPYSSPPLEDSREGNQETDPLSLVTFFKGFIHFRGEEKEKERERSISVWLPLTHPLFGIWPATQACALTGNRTNDPLVHRPMLNPLSYTRQGSSEVLNQNPTDGFSKL